MHASTFRFLSALSLTFGMVSVAAAYPEYRVTVVGPVDSYAHDINNSGVVVGNYPYSASTVHGFLNRGRGLVDLAPKDAKSSDALAINNHGQVLGHWIGSDDVQRGFLYARGTMRNIGTLPNRFTFYTDINDRGYITVSGHNLDTFEGTKSFLRAPDGSLTDIGALPFDDPVTDAHGLNNSNTIAGASGPLLFPEQPLRAISWSKGVLRDLGGFGTEPNVATAVNNCGQFTGFASVLTGVHGRVAFIYTNGRMVDIDRRPASADRFSEGASINGHGHVVGYSNHLSGFIYRGKRMESLNALIDPKGNWDIRYPSAINDNGQIAATAYRNNVQYAVRLDLIRPLAARVPEPETAAGAAVELNGADAAAEAATGARERAQAVQQ